MNHDIHAITQHRWPLILTALGIESGHLKNRHQPCPLCGGKDRYRFDDQDGKGTYYCNQCGAGNGFTLVMKLLQTDFKGAVKAVESVLGIGQGVSLTPAIQPPQNAPKRETDRIARLMHIWQQTQPLNPMAIAYYTGRGLDPKQLPQTDALRFAPSLAYWTNDTHGQALHIGNLPAIVAAITDTNGQLQGLHLTYLQQRETGQITKARLLHPQTGESLPAKKMQSRTTGSTNGAAIHLSHPDSSGRLIVAEGIETALAARELFGLPAIAALSANGMKRLVLPPDTAEALIVADNDIPRPVGYEAALVLAERIRQQGVHVKIWQSDTQGFDALDELNRIKQAT